MHEIIVNHYDNFISVLFLSTRGFEAFWQTAGKLLENGWQTVGRVFRGFKRKEENPLFIGFYRAGSIKITKNHKKPKNHCVFLLNQFTPFFIEVYIILLASRTNIGIHILLVAL